MALPWFKVTHALVHHPKAAALEAMIPLDPVGVVIRLWAWTAAYAPEGFIPAGRIDHAAQAAIAGGTPEEYVTVTAAVTALVSSGFLDPVEGGYEVHDWDEMQGAHATAAEKNREKQRRFRERNRNSNRPRNGYVTDPVTTLEEKRGEEKRREEKKQKLAPSAAEPPAASPPSPAVLMFPCSGPVKAWGLTQEQADRWREQFPAIDVLAVCRQAQAWAEANPDKRKTAKRMASWLAMVWLAKAQDAPARPAQRTLTAIKNPRDFQLDTGPIGRRFLGD